MHEIVENSRNVWKMRCLIVGGFVAGGLFLWLMVDAPPGGWTVSGGLAIFALSLPVTALLYARHYVIHLGRNDTELAIVTAGLFGYRIVTLDPAAVTGLTFYEGARQSGRDLPGATLRFAGRRLPFLVDLSAAKVDLNALVGLRPKKQKQRRRPKQSQPR